MENTNEAQSLLASLHYWACNGMHSKVFRQFMQLSSAQRQGLRENVHIASSVVIGAATRHGVSQRSAPWLHEPRQERAHEHSSRSSTDTPVEQVMDAKDLEIDDLIENHLISIIATYRDRRPIPRELLFATVAWAEYYLATTRHVKCINILNSALALDIANHFGLYQGVTLLLSRCCLETGEAERGMALLKPYFTKPYQVTSASDRECILHAVSQAAIFSCDITAFRQAGWHMLTCFSTNTTLKSQVADQLRVFYRGVWRLLAARDEGATGFAKSVAILALCQKMLRSTRWLRLPAKLFQYGISVFLYVGNYSRYGKVRLLPRSNGSQRSANPTRYSKRANALVTRAMGGIGDLLMMTPGLAALKARDPEREIHFAVPRQFFRMLEGNNDIVLKDIENDNFELSDYAVWYDLSDCPASRVESRSAPRVRKNRIEIFSSAMGVSKRELDRIGRKPRYFISDSDHRFADDFLAQYQLTGKQIIAVQPYGADTYKDYPHFEKLVELLAREHPILLFHSAPLEGFDVPNITKIDRHTIRQSASLLNRCDLLIAPDSSFIHFAAGLDVPTVVLSGPVDGRVRTMDYPLAEHLDCRDTLGCIPCWRNEYSLCKLSESRTSICMHSISVAQVYEKICLMVSGAKDRRAYRNPSRCAVLRTRSRNSL